MCGVAYRWVDCRANHRGGEYGRRSIGRVAAAIDKHVASGELAGAVSLIYRHGEIAAVSFGTGFRTWRPAGRCSATPSLVWRR